MVPDSEESHRALMADEYLARILETTVIRTLPLRKSSGFESLSRSVVGQQLATRAANAIWKRCRVLLPSWTPGHVLNTPKSVLRDTGISNAKAKTLHGLATYFASKHRPRKFASLSDDEIRSELTKIWGVGIWTVDMFLMSHLRREDVFPVGDGAIRAAMVRLYGLESAGTIEQRKRISLTWSPHRTSACRLLWSWLDSAE